MLERSLVQSRGFRNTGPKGARTGFEFLLRVPNYRGTKASLVDGVDVTVDGEQFSHTDNRIVLESQELTLEQLRAAIDLRWNLDELATVRVTKAGGLSIGVHEISVGVRIRQPYFPIEFQPSLMTETRKATIVL